jgi:cation:H+ antiporter
MNATTVLALLGGLAMLTAGAEGLVRGASRLAGRAGISRLVIGLTVVAWGTSSPELVVSITSALEGKADIAVGNVVGSNVFNVLLILGACAVIAPLAVHAQIVRREVPILIGTSLLLALLGLDGRLGRGDAAVLLAGLAAYTLFAIRAGRKETAEVKAEYAHALEPRRPERGGWLSGALLALGGLGALVLGARWFVDGAVGVAQAFGVSDTVIGLTIVAAGTSMPEVATSIVATVRGERDIAVGNVVGSNIFNILAILGVSGLVAEGGLAVAPAIGRFDIPVMVAVAVATLPVVFTGRTLSRWEGALFLGYYAAYVGYLVLDARAHDALPALSGAMLWFVLPITAVTMAVGVVREIRRSRAAAGPPPGAAGGRPA